MVALAIGRDLLWRMTQRAPQRREIHWAARPKEPVAGGGIRLVAAPRAILCVNDHYKAAGACSFVSPSANSLGATLRAGCRNKAESAATDRRRRRRRRGTRSLGPGISSFHEKTGAQKHLFPLCAELHREAGRFSGWCLHSAGVAYSLISASLLWRANDDYHYRQLTAPELARASQQRPSAVWRRPRESRGPGRHWARVTQLLAPTLLAEFTDQRPLPPVTSPAHVERAAAAARTGANYMLTPATNRIAPN